MPEVVDAQAWQASTLKTAVEGKRQIGHVSRSANWAGEDEIVLLPQLARLPSLPIEILNPTGLLTRTETARTTTMSVRIGAGISDHQPLVRIRSL